MSLVRGQYWFASNYAQKVEAIVQWLSIDAATLVIVDINRSDDTNTAIEYIREKGQAGVSVELITPTQNYLYDGGPTKKTIYVVHSIPALTTLSQANPLLALFA
jgi:hypothetical protein